MVAKRLSGHNWHKIDICEGKNVSLGASTNSDNNAALCQSKMHRNQPGQQEGIARMCQRKTCPLAHLLHNFIESQAQQFLKSHRNEETKGEFVSKGHHSEPHERREQKSDEPEECACGQHNNFQRIANDGEQKNDQRRSEGHQCAASKFYQSHAGYRCPKFENPTNETITFHT